MSSPILQFGTSRFLQAHVDLFVSEALPLGQAAGTIAVVQTTGSPESRRRVAGFRSVRPYPVLIRGLVDGVAVERQVDVSSVAAAWDADTDWPAVVEHFVHEARFVVSNTGDRGYQLDPSDRPGDPLPRSFPAKLLTLLRARFEAGAPPPTLLPCELTANNGSTLCRLVTGLAREWPLGPAFVTWLEHDCRWVNSLVDRIVSEALEPVGAVAEPYALWAVEAQAGLDMPCAHPDVQLVQDLLPFERLKLFILNLGHTVLAEDWIARQRPAGETVLDAMRDPVRRAMLGELYEREVLPVFAAIGMGAQAAAYRDTVLERFANPFLRHRLSDIASNHAAKKARRVTPLLALAEQAGTTHAMPVLQRCETSGIGSAGG